MVDDGAISVLNRLIETGRDAMDGFKTAADSVRDPALKRLFDTYAQQRAELVRELEEEVRRLGGTPQGRGSAGGALHRTRMNIRAAVSGGDEHAVIVEAERGENLARTAYEEASSQAGLPEDVRNLIARQAMRVKETYDSLRDLERAA
jgi:uncharacterized protein (TIGR02284 family)